MTYTDLKKKGKLLRSIDKYGQGPYQDAYAGEIEIWAVDDDIYIHETNMNTLAYTGQAAETEYYITVNDADDLAREICGEYTVNFTDEIGDAVRITANTIYNIILSQIYYPPAEFVLTEN